MTEAIRATPVWIKTLKLGHFRNYGSLKLELDARHVVLTGENGAGKTNLLEAVSFLSPGRGLRRVPYEKVALVSNVPRETQVAQMGSQSGFPVHFETGFRSNSGNDPQAGTWAVHVDMQGAAGSVEIGTGLQAGPGGVETTRRVHINRAAARSAELLLEHSRVLWLTPAMDGLFTGPAGDRRRFLDRMVLAIDPGHGKRVTDFERAMRSRNKLLENPTADKAWMEGLEAQMAETGVAIAFARGELVALLRRIVASGATGPDAVFPHADIMLEGLLEDLLAEGTAADLEDNYRSYLVQNRARDRAAGRTLGGPHRSNLAVRHGPKNMEAALCSTGEQKALLTGLVLAHAKLVSDVSGMTPILLLDEITAHLDEDRRAALFDLIDSIGCQAWMTGTDAPMFSALGDRARFFKVASGSVTRAD